MKLAKQPKLPTDTTELTVEIDALLRHSNGWMEANVDGTVVIDTDPVTSGNQNTLTSRTPTGARRRR